MTDAELIALYFSRSELAIRATDAQYGKYCYQISHNILQNREDAEECVNDTYLKVWNQIPPARPKIFSAYLGRITRNLSIDMWRRNTTLKRGKGRMTLAVDELTYCIPGKDDPETFCMNRELGEILNRFVGSLSQAERRVFVCRYWYLDSIHDIAAYSGFSPSKVKNMLFRIRKRLKDYLEKEGVDGL